MKAKGNLAIFAAIAAILIVSTSFSERRSIKTWAPNVVIAERKPIETGQTIAQSSNPAAVAPRSDGAVAAPDSEQPARGDAELPAAAVPSLAIIDPDATATLPVLRGARLLPTPRVSKKWRSAGAGSRATARARAIMQARRALARSSREPIQFRLAEGRS
jgi:hypothetical protein